MAHASRGLCSECECRRRELATKAVRAMPRSAHYIVVAETTMYLLSGSSDVRSLEDEDP